MVTSEPVRDRMVAFTRSISPQTRSTRRSTEAGRGLSNGTKTANRKPPMKCLVGAHDNPAKTPEFWQYAGNDHPISSTGAATGLPKHVYRRNDQSYQIVGGRPIRRPPPYPPPLGARASRPHPEDAGGRPALPEECREGAWLAIAFRLVLDTVSRGL